MAQKKKKHKRIVTNIIATLLLILSLGLIFNTSIRNTLMAWTTNKYQVSKVSKKTIDSNKNKKATYDFQNVKSVSTEAVLNAQWDAQQLPVIGGISIPDLKLNLPIFKGLENAGLYYGAGTMKENQQMGQGLSLIHI